MKKLAIALATLVIGSSHAATLYNNGPVVESDGNSVIRAGSNVFGFGGQTSTGNGVADDFTITGNSWNLSSFSVYSYQTGATNFSLTSATWSIVAGNDVNTGTVVASGTTNLTNGGLQGYRQTATATNQQRGIYKGDADIADITLSAGHYWLTWSVAGTLASGPWIPPVSDGRLGNAHQSTSSTPYALLDDASSVELPFTLYGTVSAVPEPSTYAMLLGGLGALALARRRARRS